MSRRLLTASVLAAALCAAAPVAQAGPVSSHAMLYTCCTPPEMKERILAEASASGAEFVRVDVELNGIFEAAGSRERPDWRALDEMIRLARRHDVKLVGVLLGMPTWLSDCPERGDDAARCPARDPRAFGELAAEVAEHAAGSIDHWEILNEPDARWAFEGGPEDYARMLSAAYDGIKARAPEAQVVMGGVERPWEHAWIERVLATPGADAARKFDVAAVHLRLRVPGPAANLARPLRGWRELLARHGFTGPVWVTEHGYPADPAFQRDPAFDDGEGSQAAFLRESIRLLADAGAAQVFVTLRDNLWGEYLSEGIVHIDESGPDHAADRRPAFAVVREVGAQLMLARLAAESRGAGHPLAAALQDGAALGHAMLAQELVSGPAAQ
jgi:hypothetical protein